MKDKAEAERIGWRTLKSQVVFANAWFALRQDDLRLPSGCDIQYTYVEHPGSVFVVPMTSDGEVILIRSYRYTVDRWCWEIPAGGISDKPGLCLEDAARAELLEEIGGVSSRLEVLGTFFLSNGFARAQTTYFVAWDVRCDTCPSLEVGETISGNRRLPIAEAVSMVLNGELVDGDSALGLLLAWAKSGRPDVNSENARIRE